MTLVRPTFFGIYTARSGIVASQANIDVTGHNLSNILTPGYTRQRANLTSVGDSGYKYRLACNDRISIGQGVDVNSISQLRDKGYDIRYRQANTEYGYQETKLSGLEDISRAMDEFFITNDKDDTLQGISGMLQQFIDAVQSESNDAASSSEKMTSTNAMASVLDLLKNTAKKVDSVYEQQVGDFQITVDKVNTTLQQIAALNKQIKEDALYGNPALELKDDRNLLLDELSGYLNIEYKYDAKNLDELSINFVAADGVTKLPLVQHDKYTTVSLHTEKDNDVAEVPHLIFEYNKKMKLPDTLNGATASAITDADCDTGAMGAYFDLLTGAGNFGADTEMRGIPYYQNMLDTIANTLAQNMNDINRGKVSWDAKNKQWLDINGSPLSEGENKGVELTKEQLRDMTNKAGETITWQKHQLEKMITTDWDNVTDADGLAKVIELNQDALANGITLTDGTKITWNKETKKWHDTATGQELVNQPDKAALQAAQNADNSAPFNWQKQTVVQVSPQAWETITDADIADMLSMEENQEMLKDGVYLLGKDYELLTFGDDNPEGKITASNIVKTESWQKDKNLIRHTLKADYPSGANDNLLRMETFFNRKDIPFISTEGKNVYTGSFESCVTDTNVTLGSDVKMCKSLSQTASQTVDTLDENRMAISGVDDNEEAANMMMFQKAFTASARIMTVMDEMLETLINNTGVVGR